MTLDDLMAAPLVGPNRHALECRERTEKHDAPTRVTRCVGKLTFTQRAGRRGNECMVSVEQLTVDEALSLAGVTRCRNCKFYQRDGVCNSTLCGSKVRPDFFCADGKPSDVE